MNSNETPSFFLNSDRLLSLCSPCQRKDAAEIDSLLVHEFGPAGFLARLFDLSEAERKNWAEQGWQLLTETGWMEALKVIETRLVKKGSLEQEILSAWKTLQTELSLPCASAASRAETETILEEAVLLLPRLVHHLPPNVLGDEIENPRIPSDAAIANALWLYFLFITHGDAPDELALATLNNLGRKAIECVGVHRAYQAWRTNSIGAQS